MDGVMAIYLASNGEATKALYDRLDALGAAGEVAKNLFRACKASERAKVYRRRRFTAAAYERKQWSMDNLCAALERHAEAIGVVTWGWGHDAKAIGYEHVLYVDIPTGQVSFHSDHRGAGPEYFRGWDGYKGQSAMRIVKWCAALLARQAVPA
jgi:hypothetical protein